MGEVAWSVADVHVNHPLTNVAFAFGLPERGRVSTIRHFYTETIERPRLLGIFRRQPIEETRYVDQIVLEADGLGCDHFISEEEYRLVENPLELEIQCVEMLVTRWKQAHD